jgi:hypothetical protein
VIVDKKPMLEFSVNRTLTTKVKARTRQEALEIAKGLDDACWTDPGWEPEIGCVIGDWDELKANEAAETQNDL